MKSYRSVLIGLLMMGVIILAAWITLSYRTPALTTTQADDIPDAFMEGINATILDKQGQVAMKIIAPKMVHYASNDSSELTQPELTLFRKSPQPWHITSHTARVSNGIRQVDFQDDVTIHHAADLINPDTVIKTPKLTVFPQDQKAQTSELITLIQPNTVIKATGMLADINSGSIKLLSETRGEYVPDS